MAKDKARARGHHHGLKVLLIVIVSLALVIGILNIIPPSQAVDDNPFLATDGHVMLAAHRGGSFANPENTLLAFKKSVSDYDADILEMDLALTKDGWLVVCHDLTANGTSDVELMTGSSADYYFADHDLAEIKTLNFGYQFTAKDGTQPYHYALTDPARSTKIAQNEIGILTIDDLFATFYDSNPDLLYIIEVKDEGDRGILAAETLYKLISVTYPHLLHRVVMSTFHDEVESYLANDCSDALRGASTGAAAKFVLTQYLRVNLLSDGVKFACLQVPTSYDLGITLHLDRATLINRAHKRSIAVQYWTIDDEATMRRLIGLGCDAIMTNDPALLQSVLKDMGLK